MKDEENDSAGAALCVPHPSSLILDPFGFLILFPLALAVAIAIPSPMKTAHTFTASAVVALALAGVAPAQEATVVAIEVVEPKWELVAGGQNFPEGPAWNGRDALFFSNCHGGNIQRVAHGATGSTLFLAASAEPFTLKNTNGLTFGADGALYACEYGDPGVLRIDMEGRSEYLAREYEGARLIRPNDLAFDAAGNLYFTDSWAYKRENPEGAVYRIDAKTKALTRPAYGIAFANGLAFSADGKRLIVAESAWNRLLAYDVAADGTLANRTVFADMPGGDPDGMAFDASGNLVVAHFGMGVLVVFAPDGRRVREIKVPGKKPSNVEFAGADLRTLYVTEDETNGVYRTVVDTPGVRLFHAPK